MRLLEIALATCSLFTAVAVAQQDLPGLLSSNKNLSEFESLLQQFPNVYKNISSAQGGVTVFAPSNAAFDKLNYTVLAPAFTSENVDVIHELLYYHAAQGVHASNSFGGGQFHFLPTMQTNQSYANVTGGQVISVVEQAGNHFVAVSGLAVRSSMTETVCSPRALPP